MVSGGRFGGSQRIQGIRYPQTHPHQQEDLMQEQLAGLAVNRTKEAAGDAIGSYVKDHLGEVQKQREVPRTIAKENRKHQRDVNTAVQKEGFGLLTKISDVLGTEKANIAKVRQWAISLLSRPETTNERLGVSPERAAMASNLFKPYLEHLDEKEQAAIIDGIRKFTNLSEDQQGDFISDFQDRMAGRGEIPVKILEYGKFLMKMGLLQRSSTKLTPAQVTGIKEAQEGIEKLYIQGIRERKKRLIKLYRRFQDMLPRGYLPEIEEALSIEEAAARFDAGHKPNLLKEEEYASGGPLRDPTFTITHRAHVDANDAAETSGSNARAAGTPEARLKPLQLKGRGRVPQNFVSGQRGEQITQTQQILVELGYLRPEQVSGTYDIYTMRAVNDFKARHVPRSKPNGVLTRRHMGVLNEQLKAMSPDATNPDSQQTGVQDQRIKILNSRLSTPNIRSVVPLALSNKYRELTNNPNITTLPQILTHMHNVFFPKRGPSGEPVAPQKIQNGLRLAESLGLDAHRSIRTQANDAAMNLQTTIDALGDERMKMFTARAVQESGVMKIYGDATTVDFMNNMLKKMQSKLGLDFTGDIISEVKAFIHKTTIAQGSVPATDEAIAHLDEVTLHRLVAYTADMHDQDVPEYATREQAVKYLIGNKITINDVGAAAVGSAYKHLTDLMSQAQRAGDSPDIILGRLRPVNATYDITQLIWNAGMAELTPQQQFAVHTSPKAMQAFNQYIREENRDRQWIQKYFNKFESQINRYTRRPLLLSQLTNAEMEAYIKTLTPEKQASIQKESVGHSFGSAAVRALGGTPIPLQKLPEFKGRIAPIEFVVKRAANTAYYDLESSIQRSVRRRSEKARFQQLRSKIKAYSQNP